jgi:hypothetical protein
MSHTLGAVGVTLLVVGEAGMLKMHNWFIQEYNIISNMFVLFLKNVTNDTIQALTFISVEDWCA